MSHPTCRQCAHCDLPEGYVKGWCYGLPPIQHKDGSHHSTQTPAPQVNANRRACHYFKPLADGETNVTTKSADTARIAYKAAHQEAPAAPLPAADPAALKQVLPRRKRNEP